MSEKRGPNARPCFVVADNLGRVWDGGTWVEAWCDGLRFDKLGSMYEDCAAAAEQAEALTGVKGYCWFIQLGASPEMRLGPTRGFDHFPPVDSRAKPAT